MKQGQVMDLGLPNGMEMFNNGDSFAITRRWFSLSTIFLTVFAVFWDGFLACFYIMLATPNTNPSVFLFPLIHVAIGVGLTYYALAGYINKTHIYVDHSTISIRHAPLPSFGNKTIDASDIKQVYVKRHVSHSRRGTSVTFQVCALTHSEKNLKLLSGLSSDEQALFVEQEIEKFLRIENVPVRGEMGQPSGW
ncbi:MAG: hypothetical protein JW934_12300 [Anaerolineae bacterium]|nr:hypothetical protein [Anaerolineae bacterium]